MDNRQMPRCSNRQMFRKAGRSTETSKKSSKDACFERPFKIACTEAYGISTAFS